MTTVSKPQAALHIEPELWKKVKIEAIKKDMTLTDFVSQALMKQITTS